MTTTTELTSDLSVLSVDELNELRESVIQELETRIAASPEGLAEAVLNGDKEPSEEAADIIGASNDYNSRGRGSTMARRILRDGSWEWVSEPASRGRVNVSDRRDMKHGPAYEGEIVAEYILGSSRPKPVGFYIVTRGEKTLQCLPHKKVKSGYRLTLPSGKTIDVSDPSWK